MSLGTIQVQLNPSMVPPLKAQYDTPPTSTPSYTAPAGASPYSPPASTAQFFVCLARNGADFQSRRSVLVPSNNAYSVGYVEGAPDAGSYTARAYSVLSGGTPLYESSPFVVPGTANIGLVTPYNRTGFLSHGDTYYTAWGPDGTLYTTLCDSEGFNNQINNTATGNTKTGRNVSVHTLAGHPSGIGTLVGAAIFGQHNAMGFLGGENEPRAAIGNVSWKAGGLGCYDGILYISVTDQGAGSTGAAQSTGATLLKSSDFGGTWQQPAPGYAAAGEPSSASWQFNSPKFSRISFIEYGGPNGFVVGSPDDAENWAYAISNDGKWDNGSEVYVGRCSRTRLAFNDAADWTFYRGMSGSTPLWGTLAQAVSVFSKPGKVSQTAMIYVPALGKYILPNWYYVRPAGMTPSDPAYYGTLANNGSVVHTMWEFFAADHPWGPWDINAPIWTKEWTTEGFYNPTIPAKFVQGNKLWLLFTGNYWNTALYSMQTMSLQIG